MITETLSKEDRETELNRLGSLSIEFADRAVEMEEAGKEAAAARWMAASEMALEKMATL